MVQSSGSLLGGQQPFQAQALTAFGLVGPPASMTGVRPAAASSGVLDDTTIKALQAQAAAVVSRFAPVRFTRDAI